MSEQEYTRDMEGENPSGGAEISAQDVPDEARTSEEAVAAEYAELDEVSAEDTNAENISDKALEVEEDE